jgi:pyruvate dehydrogenase E2 component (dihydrolipoamide acetyltransferase)
VRNGRITPGELHGSTFSIISVAHIGGILATPIIHFPEVAVLGVHRVQRKPAAVADRIEIRSLMNLSMSIDHRLVDGADACRFLVHVKRLLEEPGLLAL